MRVRARIISFLLSFIYEDRDLGGKLISMSSAHDNLSVVVGFYGIVVLILPRNIPAGMSYQASNLCVMR